jgi:Skp family chaperone for outer membrane proteins
MRFLLILGVSLSIKPSYLRKGGKKMKKNCFMKNFFFMLGLLAACSMLVAAYPAKETLRVGTFDSRVIAHAYAHSEMAKPMISDMGKKYILAKKEGNEELLIEVKALQQVMQQQAFGIACVADILKKVEADLPKVAEEAGVDIIVSKWEVMFKDPSVEIVDVTSHLVKVFNPSEGGLKEIENFKGRPPVPLLDLLIKLSKEK